MTQKYMKIWQIETKKTSFIALLAMPENLNFHLENWPTPFSNDQICKILIYIYRRCEIFFITDWMEEKWTKKGLL